MNIRCPKCDQRLKLKDPSKLGKKARCPKCKHVFVLRTPPPEPDDNSEDEIQAGPAEPTAASQSAEATGGVKHKLYIEFRQVVDRFIAVARTIVKSYAIAPVDRVNQYGQCDHESLKDLASTVTAASQSCRGVLIHSNREDTIVKSFKTILSFCDAMVIESWYVDNESPDNDWHLDEGSPGDDWPIERILQLNNDSWFYQHQPDIADFLADQIGDAAMRHGKAPAQALLQQIENEIGHLDDFLTPRDFVTEQHDSSGTGEDLANAKRVNVIRFECEFCLRPYCEGETEAGKVFQCIDCTQSIQVPAEPNDTVITDDPYEPILSEIYADNLTEIISSPERENLITKVTVYHEIEEHRSRHQYIEIVFGDVWSATFTADEFWEDSPSETRPKPDYASPSITNHGFVLRFGKLLLRGPDLRWRSESEDLWNSAVDEYLAALFHKIEYGEGSTGTVSSETGRTVPKRETIRAAVKRSVWRRDEGKCVECGSNENLEFDHIIPVSKGGSNTERNLQLLCEPCNRNKGANIE